MKRRNHVGARVALIPLQANELLGLLTGTLRVETPLPADTKLYRMSDGDSVSRQITAERRADGNFKDGKGIWLAVESPVCEWVDEGGQMGIFDVSLVSNR